MTTSLLTQRRHADPATDHVHVLSRHLLVAQAIQAGLVQRELPASASSWDDRFELSTLPAGQAVLLLDDLGDREALEEVCDLVGALPTRTVVLTDRLPGVVWGAVLAAGAAEVMSGTTTLADVDDLLIRVLAGESVLSDRRRRSLEAEWTDWLAEDRELHARAASLTPREHVILERLTQGQRVSDIGSSLGVSEATVRSQVKSLRAKLGVDSQLGAVAVAHRLAGRLLDPHPVVVPAPPLGA